MTGWAYSIDGDMFSRMTYITEADAIEAARKDVQGSGREIFYIGQTDDTYLDGLSREETDSLADTLTQAFVEWAEENHITYVVRRVIDGTIRKHVVK